MSPRLGPLGQLGGARAHPHVQAVGQRQDAIVDVVELGDLVLVHEDLDPARTQRLDGLEAAMGPARRHRVGAVGQGPDLVEHEAGQHDPADEKARPAEDEEVAVHHRRAVHQERVAGGRLGGPVEEMGHARRPHDLPALGHPDAHAGRAQHPGEGGHERVVDARVHEGDDRESRHESEKQPRRPHHRAGEHGAGRRGTELCDRAAQTAVDEAPDDPAEEIGEERAQGDPDHGRGRVAADVVADGQPADGPGDDQKKPEDLYENHALSPHSHALQKQCQATWETPAHCEHSRARNGIFGGADAHRQPVR